MIEVAFVVCVVILVFAAYKMGEADGMTKGGTLVAECISKYKVSYSEGLKEGKASMQGWEEEALQLRKKLDRLNAKMQRELKANKEKRK